MRTVSVSAPGKLMLFGEHSVVYGNPCIVTAVDQRLTVSITLAEDHKFFTIDAPEVAIKNYQKPFSQLGIPDIPKGARFIELAVKNFYQNIMHEKPKTGLHVKTSADFSATFGFGSSSASTVAVIKALSVFYEIQMSEREIFDLSYKTVLDVQKTGSGFDVAAAVYGGTVFYNRMGKEIEPLPLSELPLIVGYSGRKADTVSLISQVSERYTQDKYETESIFLQISEIVLKAKEAILRKDWENVGFFMNQNQEYLVRLGVSTVMLDTMISAAIQRGAYGAKLSGAGGGDCMIALSSGNARTNVEEALEKVGGEILETKTHAQGVRVE